MFIALRVRSLLFGRSPDAETQRAIDEVIGEQEGVEFAFNTITIQFGPDAMLAAKARMQSGTPIDAAVANSHSMERRLRERVPDLR